MDSGSMINTYIFRTWVRRKPKKSGYRKLLVIIVVVSHYSVLETGVE